MKKMLKAVAAAALTTALFAGCGNSTKIELYYYKQENQEGLKKIIKTFEQQNPDITITPFIIPNDADSAMSARAAQGSLPEIMQMQSYARVQEYAEKGYLENLTDNPALANIVDSAKPAVTYNDKLYAMPMDFAGIGIIYNKDIFAKYNIPVPTTYRELKDACETLKENNVVPFAALLKENWSAGHFITMIHTALLEEKGETPAEFIEEMNEGKASYGDINKDKLFEIMTFYKDNMNENKGEMDGGAQQQSFANGESAMMVQGLWAFVDALKINPSLNAGFIPFPVYNDPAMNKMYADVDSTFGVSSQADETKKAAALKFLNFLASEEGQKLWVSEYKLTNSFKGCDFSSLGTPYDDLMKSVAEKGSNPWAFSQYPSEVFEKQCKEGAQQYMLGTISADKVIADIDDAWKASNNK